MSDAPRAPASDATAATEALAAGLKSLLDREAAAGRSVRLWWRDDDAVRASPALARLLALAGTHRTPVSLAVIPALAEPDLAALVRAHPLATVLQHGFAHDNHAPAGAKKCELAEGRPPETVLAELSAGRGILTAMFGAHFVPVLVPPWNRAGEAILARAGEIGFVAVSMHGGHGARNRIDTHLDPIAWRGDRSYVGDHAFLAMLDGVLGQAATTHASAAREAGAGVIGLLTHHRDHDEAVWRVLDTFLAVAAAHPAVRVPPITDLVDAAP